MSPPGIAAQRQQLAENANVPFDLLLADTEVRRCSRVRLRRDTPLQDQWRSFARLERYLRHGQLLAQQSLFQLEKDQQHRLCNSYYAINDAVLRELLGQKLSSGLRNHLGDIGERLHVPLPVCERNFDNQRRVYKRALDVLAAGGNALAVLRRHYLISEALARKYLHACYVRYHRWNVAHKKLQFLTFADVEHLAAVHMQRWTVSEFALELDPQLRAALRDRLSLGDKHQLDAYAARVCGALRTTPVAARLLAALDAKCVALLIKPLLQMASDLSSAKEFRDFPLDLLTKLLLPLRST